MGTESALVALTETRGGPAPAGSRLYVGIDVGRRGHVVTAIPRERMENGSWERMRVRHVVTSGSGFRELTDWLDASGYGVDHIAIGCEPTGGWYAQTVATWLERHGYTVSWLQNVALHERRQLLIGKQTKTDALDARLIARLLYERDAFGQHRGFLRRPPRSTEALRMLVRNRHRLIEQRTRYRLQLTAVEDVLFPELKDFFKKSITGVAARRLLEAYATPAQLAAAPPADLYHAVIVEGRHRLLGPRLAELHQAAAETAGLTEGIEPILQTQDWLLYQLRHVDDQIVGVEEAIASALEAWSAQERAVLNSLPGMTMMRQAVLLSAIGDIGSFDNDRQLRKYLGWYPELRESGSSMSKHHLGRSGNRLARREIWLWTVHLLSPVSRPSAFRLYYGRLRERGMKGQTAVGHVAGKLISVLFFCVRHAQPYDPDRHRRDLGLGDVSITAEVAPPRSM